jgi:hypothetical protein
MPKKRSSIPLSSFLMFTTEHFMGLWPDKRIFIITMHLPLQPELFKILNTVQIRPVYAPQ